MESINCLTKRRQTPPWIVKHFKRSFESLYVKHTISKSLSECNNANSFSIPKIIYLTPKEKSMYPSFTVPNENSSATKTEITNPSLKISQYQSTTIEDLNNDLSQTRSPEKYISSLNYNRKTIESVTSVKKGKSVANISKTYQQVKENSFEINEAFQQPEKTKSTEKIKFGKRYIKRKIFKLFRSNGKLNETYRNNPTSCFSPSFDNNDSETQVDLPNDALRNLSFTAAMMSKIEKSKIDSKIEDHAKQIPSSTLRFWKKPCEEKIKACQRRTQDNIYGSNEVLLKINSTTDNIKIPSELSLFCEDINMDSTYEFGKPSNAEIKNTIKVSGYDKAFQRYRNIVNQSKHFSRKDRTLSVAYDSENINHNNSFKMRNCQSSGCVNMLAKNLQVVNPETNDVSQKMSPSDLSKNQSTQKICPPKMFLTQHQTSRQSRPSISPPAYDRMPVNNRRSRPRIISLILSPSCQLTANPQSRISSIETFNKQGPKPPPRSDSLIRSFELICKNLRTSISEPRGDSFKIFKNQSDYQAWLKNLPYHNPDKISTLLRLRSKVARRQCVSELLNVSISDFGFNDKRRHSWPLLSRSNFSSLNNAPKRSNSLSRVKNKVNRVEDFKMNLESPSLCNYSRLYCLRNSTGNSKDELAKNGSLYQNDPSVKSRIPMSNIKSSAFSIQNRRSGKHRQRQESMPNFRMTESCH